MNQSFQRKVTYRPIERSGVHLSVNDRRPLHLPLASTLNQRDESFMSLIEVDSIQRSAALYPLHPKRHHQRWSIQIMESTPILTVPSTKSTKKKTSSKKSASKKAKKKGQSAKSSKPALAENAQVSLLSDFWTELGKEEADKEEDRFNEFFEDSVHNTKSSARDQEDSVSKRIQVGLYPADAELLEVVLPAEQSCGSKKCKSR